MINCTGQLLAKDSYQKIREHYSSSFKDCTQSYNEYITIGVATGKSWLCGKDDFVCNTCKDNEKIGVIPLKDKFPSGHLYPPAGQMCRCALQPAVSY